MPKTIAPQLNIKALLENGFDEETARSQRCQTPIARRYTQARTSGGLPSRLRRHIKAEWKNVEAKRLVKRLKRHRKELLVFLYNEGVPFDNNHAERRICGGVVMRKNSYCNRSEAGAETQAVLMSVFATLKQRDIPGTKIVVEAVREYIAMKNLPDLSPNG